MTVRIALLRAVNVGGHDIVAMSGLRDLLSALGFADARPLLQSGSLVVRRDWNGDVVERRLGLRGTARNWNTVLMLAALAEA